MRRHLAVLLPASLLATTLTAAVAVSSVQAVNGTGVYGEWTVATSQSGSFFLGQDGNGFLDPAASWTSTATNVTFPTGASTWLGPTTPFGAYFGSSQGRAYMNQNLGPASGPSTITYTFASVTPTGNWGFALGDIDADTVRITAADSLGDPVPTGTWYESSFNYCNVSPKPSGCPTGTHTDVPAWDPATQTLTGSGSDTNGAAAWFRPKASIKTLTFTFTRITGLPVYQTWFAVDELPTPTPSPTSTSASPSPTSTSASPSPTETSPSPSPTETSPSPSPTSTSPSPSPTETSPSPSPTSTSPSPSPTETSPSPSPTETSASPSPEPTPAPEPQKPTSPVDLPDEIVNPGTTVIVERPITTNAGQTATVTVTCAPYSQGRVAVAPRGDYELCTVRKYAKRGKITVTTYGNPVKVAVTLRAPATSGYSAYKAKKTYYSR